MSQERIEAALYRAVDSLNKQLPPGVNVEKSLDAPLSGAFSKLDSIDFVTFIMEVEDKINEEFGAKITIEPDENLLSKDQSPFSSLRRLIEYLEEILKQEGHAPS